jgi:hypothetical protein
MKDQLHPTHVTQGSFSSHYDEYCVNCGETDRLGSWGKLAEPCNAVPLNETAKETPEVVGTL